MVLDYLEVFATCLMFNVGYENLDALGNLFLQEYFLPIE